jgi:hypothetical protein
MPSVVSAPSKKCALHMHESGWFRPFAKFQFVSLFMVMSGWILAMLLELLLNAKNIRQYWNMQLF